MTAFRITRDVCAIIGVVFIALALTVGIYDANHRPEDAKIVYVCFLDCTKNVDIQFPPPNKQ